MAHKFVVHADQQPPRTGTKVLKLTNGVATWEDESGGGGSLPLSATLYGTGTSGTAGNPCPTDEFLRFDSGFNGTTVLPSGAADGARVGFINVDHTDVQWNIDPDGDAIDTRFDLVPPITASTPIRLGPGGSLVLLRTDGKWAIEVNDSPALLIMNLVPAGAIIIPTWVAGLGSVDPYVIYDPTSDTLLLTKNGSVLSATAMAPYTVPARAGVSDGVSDLVVPAGGVVLRKGGNVTTEAVGAYSWFGQPGLSTGGLAGNQVLDHNMVGRHGGDLGSMSFSAIRNLLAGSDTVNGQNGFQNATAAASETAWVPTGVANTTRAAWWLRVNSVAGGGSTIHGVTVYNDQDFSFERYYYNDTAEVITWVNESGSASTATYRVKCPLNADYEQQPGEVVKTVYDNLQSRWVMQAGTGAASDPTPIALSSSSNQVAVDAALGTNFQLNALAEDTEFQVPSNGAAGMELVIAGENTGGQVITANASMINLGDQGFPGDAGAKFAMRLFARDFGSGLVWGYIVSHADPVVTLTSASNVVAIDFALGRKFKLVSLTEDTELQVPTNAVEGDEVVLNIDNSGGQLITAAPSMVNLGQLDFPDVAGSKCIVTILARDFGAGLEYGYIVAHSLPPEGETLIDNTITSTGGPHTIAAFATSNDNATYIAKLLVSFTDPTAQESWAQELTVHVFRNSSGVLSTPNIALVTGFTKPDVAWDVTAVVSGSNILIQVTLDSTNPTTARANGKVLESVAP